MLALYGLGNFASGTFSSISTILLFLDVYIGAYIFVTERDEEIGDYIGFFRKSLRQITRGNTDNDGNRDNSFLKF